MPDSWRVAARYISGRPLDGTPRTDSTFFHRGTKAFTRTGRASRWAMLAGWQRAAWRTGLPGTLGSLTTAYVVYPTETVATGSAVVATAAGVAGWKARRKWKARRHRQTYVLPLHQTLSRSLGLASRGTDWLAIPQNFHEEDVESRIYLPSELHLSPEVRRIIRTSVEDKLGLRSADWAWHTIGRRPWVAVRPAPQPPGRVQWEAIAEAALNTTDARPVIGYGPRGILVHADLDADSPHILVSAGSGAGKSVLIRSLLSQGLNRGGGGVVLDYKRHSHTWAKDLPGVLYARDIAEIHDALVALGVEAERRNRAADDGGDVGPRIILVCEEMNATILKLTSYWAEVRTREDPKTSPAVTALRDIVFMGRAVKMNVLAVAQMMTARTLGGPEVRENFATRCLSRCTQNAVKMLAPEIMPVRLPRGLGRWLIVAGGEVVETQVAYMSDEEARTWATAGATAPADVLVSPNPVDLGKSSGTVPIPVGIRDEPGRLVSLTEAAENLPGPRISADNLRKIRQRQRGSFPHPARRDGNTDLYRLNDLIEWKKRRDAVRVVSGKVA